MTRAIIESFVLTLSLWCFKLLLVGTCLAVLSLSSVNIKGSVFSGLSSGPILGALCEGSVCLL